MELTSPEAALSAFHTARPRLFGIAYRMLGSPAEAEDIVQDVWLRWQATDHSTVRDPSAFLATAAARLAINATQSARTRRETYIGPWLPEPVDTTGDPALGAERAEALSVAVLLLLEKLNPPERAAYVLREAFDYAYSQIAEILETTESNTRQLVSRARKHLAGERQSTVSKEEQSRLLTAFLAAAQTGDAAALEKLFAADIVSYSDGGGVVRAARVPVAGPNRVARFIAAFSSHFWTGTASTRAEANGQTSVLVSRDGNVLAVVTLTASAEGVHQLQWILNPAKTAPWRAFIPPPA